MANITQNHAVVLDVFTVRRGVWSPQNNPEKFGYYQIKKYEVVTDALDNPATKLSTFDDVSHTIRGDLVAIYQQGLQGEQGGSGGQLQKRQILFAGVVDSVDVTTVIGSPNVITCRQINSVFDFEFVITPENTGNNLTPTVEEHFRLLTMSFLATKNRNNLFPTETGYLNSLTQGMNILTNMPTGADKTTKYTYQPTKNFTTISMQDFLYSNFKKYGVVLLCDSVAWQAGQVGLAFQPMFRVQIGRMGAIDETGATYLPPLPSIKDNMSDLFDWTFTTNVGSTVANAVVMFDPKWADNQSASIQNIAVTGGSTEKKVVYGVHANKNSSNLWYNDQSWTAYDGWMKRVFFLTTDGQIVDNGWSADMVPINPSWSITAPIKIKTIVLENEDTDRPIGGDGKPSKDPALNTAWYLQKARSVLELATYAHQFTVKLRLDSVMINWRKQLLIGQYVDVWYKGVKYASVVSGRSLSSDQDYITITLGHNRNKIAPALRELIN